MTTSGSKNTGLPLDEFAREVRSQLGELWQRVNNAVDSGTVTAQDRAALQRELAELARIPWDIAESLNGEPDVVLNDAAITAHATLLRHAGLEQPTAAAPQSPPPVPLPATSR